MNRLFAQMVDKDTPKFNPDIVNGLACIYVPYAEEWIHQVFKSASKSFPKGLSYEGYERCTHFEEFFRPSKTKSKKWLFDLADSDLYLVKFKFSFEEDGVKRPLTDRYIYLPFVNEAGTFKLGGTLYHVTGVLSDKVISPGTNSIFVRLIRDRLKFHHVGHSVMVGNRRESINVVHSRIYRKPGKEKSAPSTTHAFTSIAHYLFARFGFTETFRKYAGFVPTVGHYKPGIKFDKNVIVCRSSYYGTHSKPRTFIGQHYHPSDIYLEIPNEYWNARTAALVAGFFYVIDHFPDRIDTTRLDSRFIWTVLLGHIIFSGVYSEAKLYNDTQEHFNSLDDYLDVIVADKLKEIGWVVNDFYDLIAKIMIDFPTLLLGNQIDINSMFNKNIEILYYMLIEITSKIFRVIYKLRKNETKRPLNYRNVDATFSKLMTSKTIFNLTKDKMICETVSYCGDHMYPKLTSKITEQETGSMKNKKKNARLSLTDNDHIHSSMLEAGNVLFLSKSNPRPNTRINPYVKIDLKTGTLIPDPAFKDILDNLQKMLVRTNNANSDLFEDDENKPMEFEDEDLDSDISEFDISELSEYDIEEEADVDDDFD